jgi:hypothetical protein
VATYVPPKQGSDYVFYVSLVSQANTKVFQANPTLAAGDVKIAVDDAAPANLTTLPVVDADFTKRIKVTMGSDQLGSGANATLIFSDAAGAEWCDLAVTIQTAARQVDDLAYPATTGRSMVVDASGLVDANAVKVGPTGSGTAQTARDLGGTIGVAGAGLTSVALASTGLDSIATTAPTGVASTFREMVVATWRRLFKKTTMTATEIKTFADNGTSVLTTQTGSNDATTQSQGAAT